jgi:hypothetical protein
MSRLGFALSMLLVVAVAGWAYNVNYETAEALKRVRALEREIAAERERLAVLDVEWARLNAPERLRRLVAEHNGRLLLMPMAPDHFGATAQVPYPPAPPGEAAPPGSAPALPDGPPLPPLPPLAADAPDGPGPLPPVGDAEHAAWRTR